MERRSIIVTGIVQGVGFRPFVHALAGRLQLSGFVRNQSGAVEIEAEGSPAALDAFVDELQRHPPPLARVERVDARPCEVHGSVDFQILESESQQPADPRICADVATCDDCARELFDPTNRRFRYPFINCTNCGPRLTIITGAPYDRQQTTMASFPMCVDCRREYEDPTDRRFHAQPVACAACGPVLSVLDASGARLTDVDPLQTTAAALRAGGIVAIKGLGGFHLACDAGNETAVRELRRRKHRDEKPLAVMMRDVSAIESRCCVSEEERELLLSRARPIVLLRKLASYDLAGQVAPQNPFVGVMLPYTPVHLLLLDLLPGGALVMTSGNRSDEPIAYEEADAVARLSGIADLFLTHDRPIHVRCDDSVTRIIAKRESPLRRSRGYAPQPIPLPLGCDVPVLAVGGQLKSTFALGRGRQATISHHLGDLDHFDNFRAFERDIALYERLFALHPQVIVHDLHPDYTSTRYALRRCAQTNIRPLAVQHHHAHMASCMAEHGLNQRVIGVCFDGTGFGTDGAIWGGEFLVGDYGGFERFAHLRYVPMPGADRAIHEPWRMAVAHLRDAEADVGVIQNRIDRAALRTVDTMLQRGFNSPQTSSAGRLFDAVASIAGIRDVVHLEAQAAMQLEWLAYEAPEAGVYPLAPLEAGVIDTRPIIRGVAADAARGVWASTIARRFHSTVVTLIADTCQQIREQTKLNTVVLSGGVFLNALLTDEVMKRLSDVGFELHRHLQVPTNDGGLSLGQIAIGFCRLQTPSPRDEDNQHVPGHPR